MLFRSFVEINDSVFSKMLSCAEATEQLKYGLNLHQSQSIEELRNHLFKNRDRTEEKYNLIFLIDFTGNIFIDLLKEDKNTSLTIDNYFYDYFVIRDIDQEAIVSGKQTKAILLNYLDRLVFRYAKTFKGNDSYYLNINTYQRLINEEVNRINKNNGFKNYSFLTKKEIKDKHQLFNKKIGSPLSEEELKNNRAKMTINHLTKNDILLLLSELFFSVESTNILSNQKTNLDFSREFLNKNNKRLLELVFKENKLHSKQLALLILNRIKKNKKENTTESYSKKLIKLEEVILKDLSLENSLYQTLFDFLGKDLVKDIFREYLID